MYADSADYSEWKNRRRATGLVFSASTMSQKFGWAFGTAFAGWLLTLVGYQANIAQSEAVKEGLRLLVSLIPAFIGILSLIVMLFYKLDEDTMSNIASELEERRKNRNDDLAAT
jgi:GPH family glycoside/pentoside/hexuronide:cation symporter